MTDTKFLGKKTRKRLQVARAKRASDCAKQVKLADKISNLRDILASPPADWSEERRQGYFDWAKQVVDQIRGVNPKLERVFDRLYLQRPKGPRLVRVQFPKGTSAKEMAAHLNELRRRALEQKKGGARE